MKKNILILLAVFSVVASAGGIYLAYSYGRSLSHFGKILNLHHADSLQEHLLYHIQKVEIDLYWQSGRYPESAASIEGDLADVEKSISACYNCHQSPEVIERLDGLRHQIERYKGAIRRTMSMGAGTNGFRNSYKDVHIIGESLIKKVQNMVVRTGEKLREQSQHTLRQARKMEIVMLSLIATGPLVMIIFAFIVIRGVTMPVQVLLRATRTLKAGHLEHQITGLKDEFGELAVAFNDMAGSLRATMQAIEESEKRYRLLFETVADAIFILDAEGDQTARILRANQAAAAMHGYTVDELRNMKIGELNSPQHSSPVYPRIERIRRGEWVKFEVKHRRKDGTVFPVEVLAGLLETGGHKYVLAIDHDLTERKRAERELKRMERIRVAGELATGLAHEIKNPLACIKVSIEALFEETYLSAEDRDALGKVIGEIRRIEYLMQGLLNFARPPKPELLSTDVNSILEIVAALVLKERVRSGDPEKAIHLNGYLQRDLPEIMADPMQLKQIFMNLLLNSVDAMPEGGTITARTFFDPETDCVHIALSDTGRGIAPSSMAKIFDPFFTTKAKGTGLGLSITKRLVEEHGGSIRVENNRDGGVTCMITLPARKAEGALTP